MARTRRPKWTAEQFQRFKETCQRMKAPEKVRDAAGRRLTPIGDHQAANDGNAAGDDKATARADPRPG